MNFFSLKDGTVINLDAIAYFHRDPKPQTPPRAQVEIVFASACRNEVSGATGVDPLTLVLDEEDTGAFLDAMQSQGVNVEGIRNSFRDVLDYVAPVTIQSIVLTPPTVPTTFPATANGMITLSGPAPPEGAIVQLTMATSPIGAIMISLSARQVTIPANSSSGSFSIQCSRSPILRVSVVVTATLGASQVSATVTFTP